MLDGEKEIATLVKSVVAIDELMNPSEAKVVVNRRGEALYFSRSMIPFINKAPQDNGWKGTPFSSMLECMPTVVTF